MPNFKALKVIVTQKSKSKFYKIQPCKDMACKILVTSVSHVGYVCNLFLFHAICTV